MPVEAVAASEGFKRLVDLLGTGLVPVMPIEDFAVSCHSFSLQRVFVRDDVSDSSGCFL